MDSKELEIIEKMKQIRFLKGGIEEIELFEKLNREISEYNDIECIPYLCGIMEDNVYNCSVIEEVLDTILFLIKNNDTHTALQYIIDSSKLMKGHAGSWAVIIHTQLLRDEEIRAIYTECVRKSDDISKQYILDILDIIDKEQYLDACVSEIINQIK